MEPLPVGGGLRAFSKREITNAFNNFSLNMSKSDPNHVGLNAAHRAPAFLNRYNQQSSNSRASFKCYRHDLED